MTIFKLLSLKGYLFSLLAAILTYLFYILVVNNGERFYTVQLDINYPPFFESTSRISDSVNVTLKGNPASLARISRDDMKALVDLSSIQNTGPVRGEVQLIRSGVFSDINNVEIILEPSVITVDLESVIVKEVSIEATYINSLPRGYLIRSTLINPSRIIVSGPQSVIESLVQVPTEEIDLSVLSESVSRNMRLKKIDFVSFEGLEGNDVRVFTSIQPVIEVKTFDGLRVKIENQNENLVVENIENYGYVTLVVQGPQLSIENLNPEPVIDISNITSSGVYRETVGLILPPDIEIISIAPPIIEVELRRQREANITTVPRATPQRDIEETDKGETPLATPAPKLLPNESENDVIEEQ